MKKIIWIFCVLFILAALLCGCSDVRKIEFDEETYYVAAGESITPSVTIRPSSSDYELSVENTSVASVDGKKITGLKDGSITKITAKAGKDGKTATATLIVTDGKDMSGISYEIKQARYVSFVLTNHTELELESGLLDTETYLDGQRVTRALPSFEGYFVHGWYADSECTQEFDATQSTVAGDMTLYCYAVQLENTFAVNSNGQLIGILYPGLKHPNLVLPEKVNGQTVTGVAKKAFMGDTLLETVVIPATYETIGEFAFAGCTNLTEVILEEGSHLKSVGQFAFSVTSEVTADEETEEVTVTANEDACAKLTKINLPDSVSEIGNFAFGYCTSLVLDGIPSSLEKISYGAFYKTKINDVDLQNVTEIESFAFADCPVLNVVQNTQKVVSCGAGAFTGSATYLAQYQKSPYVIYIGTILVGCNSLFGRGMTGNGRHEANEDITLVADSAFEGKNQTELTLYINKPGVLFGDDVFNDSDGVCIVVTEEAIETYKTNNPYYKSHFCTKVVIRIDDDPNSVNFGEHTLLKFSDSKYYYDRFTVIQDNGQYRSPEVIDITALPEVGNKIKRINTRAINLGEGGGKLKTLIIGNAEASPYIALLAVINCGKLTRIDLTHSSGLIDLELNGFQFDSINKDCKIYVKEADFETYKNLWKDKGVAYERLTAE